MLIDTHAHLDFPEFAGDLDSVLQRAKEAGVGKIIAIGTTLQPSRTAIGFAEQYPEIYAVVGIQLLDGVAAGIFGVISVLFASDLMRGTGRFNLAQGLTALSVGIGATLSNVTAGFVVQWFGYSAGFLYLTGIAACALLFFLLLMPETKGTANLHDRVPTGPQPEAA